MKIIKVYFKPKDIVAIGTWSDNNDIREIVVNKLTIKSLKNVK